MANILFILRITGRIMGIPAIRPFINLWEAGEIRVCKFIKKNR